jgi:hypothetical protein
MQEQAGYTNSMQIAITDLKFFADRIAVLDLYLQLHADAMMPLTSAKFLPHPSPTGQK